MKCGKPLLNERQEYCQDCEKEQQYFEEGKSLWQHKSPISDSIYRFKYHNERIFGEYYAYEICVQFKEIIRKWNPDVIIPIPLHKQRRRKRGYNQSEIVALNIGCIMHIPVNVNILKRKKCTAPQKRLDRYSRKRNLHNAFRVCGELKGIQTVLLIDDIYTTGNTINQAARTLKMSGVENVYFLSVSIGQGY